MCKNEKNENSKLKETIKKFNSSNNINLRSNPNENLEQNLCN
jgi:hypothetical protein